MERVILVVAIVAIIAAGIAAGGGFLFYRVQEATSDHWSPRNYVPADGECFVPPQGDPLYDAHYAQNVNAPNCQAFKNQSEAKNIDAETRAQNAETNRGIAISWCVGIFLGCVLGFLIYITFFR